VSHFFLPVAVPVTDPRAEGSADQVGQNLSFCDGAKLWYGAALVMIEDTPQER
jgi:hypothetical protein